MKIKRVVVVATLLSLGGCVSSSVQQGALIGAGTGAVLGAGTGVLISDDHLLGSHANRDRGDIELSSGSAIAASTVVGLLFGGLIGAMAGKVHEHPEAPPEDGAQASTSRPSAF